MVTRRHVKRTQPNARRSRYRAVPTHRWSLDPTGDTSVETQLETNEETFPSSAKNPAILDQAMKLVLLLRRIWNRPFGGVFFMAILFGAFLIAAQVDRIWGPDAEERVRIERLEQLLWRQAGAGQISSALEQLELAELAGAIEPERAEAIRKTLERKRAELREKFRVVAQQLVRQKRKKEMMQEQSRD